MNYKKVFFEKDDQDLISLLGNESKMSLEAKIALKDMIYSKNLEFEKDLMEKLEQSINEASEKIKRVEFANYLGLKIENDQEKIKVKRAQGFHLANWTGIIVGFLLSFLLALCFVNWSKMFNDGFEFITFISALIQTSVGLFGLFLMLICLKRVLENWNFLILKESDELSVNYLGSDISSLTISGSELRLNDDANGLSLVLLDSNVEKVIISTTGSEVHRATLRGIYQLLKK